MHEMSITKSVLEAVKREMDRAALARLYKVRLRIGELTAVEPEALRFCFEISIKGTPFEGAALEIEEVPLTGLCRGCASRFRITSFDNTCPGCGSTSIDRVGGTELDIISMEGA
ncbi:MAG TPA: hydrogenase maturation nickel metallochaperone HypA [Deltaproteobacteria bacterium]|nr:MAG: hydrogenase maturation nickel metallochaperone HypA [Deltaproteobacteria bacterium GWA2_55_82]OGQ64156.1 MAG: hydrogenase maturation nickel metallochaperone HypA [Deltaproteobacteria bacterium RIFCSPLOWO2_02_FULL_55_12]OIJ74609.1 MAG: hydrogenase maturation nickel metallochaperone HypA [Deltaproteobacteria bacterium GWC2_55_46]HBG46448.1 hydrogenase maturation nickel metallochaperone HypA [Deltaproteobacteria bacterium]HCY10660.1 hydrogenase maturation nickel metallochaperone HypA [Delt